MAKFNYNDFVTDDIPECPLSNSKVVQQCLEQQLFPSPAILEINLVGIMFKGVLLHEWHILFASEKQKLYLKLPLFMPYDVQQAESLIAYHSQASLANAPKYTYAPGDYLLIAGKYPCQLIMGDDNVLYLKRFNFFASQHQIQEFMQQVLQYKLVTATMVIITKHNFCYKGLQDIGWLLNLDGMPSLMSMDRRFLDTGFSFIDDFQELPIDTIFEIDGQKYIVTEDEDNGEFIAKITSRQAHEYEQVLKTKITNIIN